MTYGPTVNGGVIFPPKKCHIKSVTHFSRVSWCVQDREGAMIFLPILVTLSFFYTQGFTVHGKAKTCGYLFETQLCVYSKRLESRSLRPNQLTPVCSLSAVPAQKVPCLGTTQYCLSTQGSPNLHIQA